MRPSHDRQYNSSNGDDYIHMYVNNDFLMRGLHVPLKASLLLVPQLMATIGCRWYRWGASV
jgi:hypothetical protein